MNKFGKIVLVAALAIGLASCQKPLENPGSTTYRPFTAHQRLLVAQLRSAHITVFKQGDRLTLVIPVDEFFVMQRTELKRNREHLMNQAAMLVKSYKAYTPGRASVFVTGYTDTVFAHKTRQTLSKDYAHVIASFLWRHGVTRNSITIRGMGAKTPIASNHYPAGTAANRRVVIEVR